MRALGWRPPTENGLLRARRWAAGEAGDSVLSGITPAPTSNLTSWCVVLDQLSLGSCQTQATAQVLRMAMAKAGITPWIFSRLWAYYKARALEGNAARDVGASIADVFTVLATAGIPPEDLWPYVEDKFAIHAYDVDRVAYDNRGKIGINYHPITSTGDALILDIERALTAGYGVTFGCAVGPTYCSPPTGIVTPPKESEVIGLHAQAVVGHNRAEGWFLVQGSWGTYGDLVCPPGCTRYSYDHVNDRVGRWSDLWIVRALPGGITS